MSQYKVFAVDINIYGAIGVVITAAYQNAGGYHKAESFLLIPNNEDSLYPRKLDFSVKSFSDSPIELNEELMLNVALDQAKCDLATYLEQRTKEGSSIGFVEAPKIKEDNDNLLIHLWLRGRITQLRDVYNKTECEALRGYLDIILGLPVITSKEL